jgi:hypothetical protein
VVAAPASPPPLSVFSAAASTPAPAGSSSPANAETGARDWYAHDVWVVDTPPSSTALLARFDEPPGEGCEGRLLSHARGLGANRLYIDRAKPCGGAAYMVRVSNAGANAHAGGGDAGGSGALRSTPRLRGGQGLEALSRWVRARVKLPPSVSPEQAAGLCVVVQFEVSPMRRIWSVGGQPVESSGNHDFDESVRVALESAIDEHATVPAPEDDFVGEYVQYRVEVSGGDRCRRATGR